MSFDLGGLDIVIYEKRQFPTSLHFNEFVATLMFSVSFLLGGRSPERDVWCVDEGTNATQENNNMCAVQGMLSINRDREIREIREMGILGDSWK